MVSLPSPPSIVSWSSSPRTESFPPSAAMLSWPVVPVSVSFPSVALGSAGTKPAATITVAPPLVKVMKPAEAVPRTQPVSLKETLSVPLPKTCSVSVSDSAMTRAAERLRVLPPPARSITSIPLDDARAASVMFRPVVANCSVSVPVCPSNDPSPETMIKSFPSPPKALSVPVPIAIVSLPLSPKSRSLPSPPVMLSSPLPA